MIRWFERFSLDAVVVAVAWGYALGGWNAGTLTVLALSTWLTYVADRLRDAGKGRAVTDRHLYYQSYYRPFLIAWVILFAMDVVIALLVLPGWTILYGLCLVALILVYLILVQRITHPTIRTVFKRLAVPVIFTAGVVLMSGSWQTPAGIHGSLVLLVGAIANLVLISLWEDKDHKMPWLVPVFAGSLLGLTLTGLPGLVGAAGFALVGFLSLRNRSLPLRILADGVLVVMALVV